MARYSVTCRLLFVCFGLFSLCRSEYRSSSTKENHDENVLLTIATETITKTKARNNILFLMTDQMRFDARSDKITPNLNKLGKEGAEFVNGYSTTPTCTPARSAILTGRSPWFHGLLGYADSVAKNYPQGEYIQKLDQLGYKTAAIGKDHFGWNNTKDTAISHGFQGTLIYDGAAEFDDYHKWFQEQKPGKDPDCGRQFANSWKSYMYAYNKYYHPTAWTGRNAVKFLSDHRNSSNPNQPFFLKVSFHRPHSPYDPPLSYYNAVPNSELKPPVVGGSWDEFYAKVENGCSPANVNSWCGKMPMKEIMKSRRAYLANIMFVDEEIGKIVDALKRYEFLNSTFIIFVSDHGDGQGEHYHWRKSYPYEFSSHIPFLVWWYVLLYVSEYTMDNRSTFRPEQMYPLFQRGSRIKNVVELRDLFPTFLDVANGAELVPKDINGSSLLPLLDSKRKSAKWREWIDLEHSLCYNQSNIWSALTDGKMKYIYRAFYDDEQLFNLTADPHEMISLHDKPEYHDELLLWRKRLVTQYINEQRGSEWVEDDKLVRRTRNILHSPHFPMSAAVMNELEFPTVVEQ